MRLTIQNLRSDDALLRARAEAFLLENADPGVRPRAAEQVDRAVATGQGLLIRDGANIRGISLVYQYDPGAPGMVDHEIGTMRVTAQGLGLQTFLAWLHMIQITLEDEASLGEIFAVVSPGTASEHNLTQHAGMRDWSPPPALALMRRTAGVPFDPNKRVLAADGAAVANAFSQMRALHVAANGFRAPKGEANIAIEMGWFDPDILE